MVPLHRAKPVALDAVGLTRSFDATDINAIVNHPAIFPLVALPGIARIDLTGVVSDPQNVLLMGQGGGFLFAQDEPGIYEVHTNFLPQYRGRHMLAHADAAKRWMFTHTDCMVINTRVPVHNRAALAAIKRVGFSHLFDRPKAWPTAEGHVDVKFYGLAYQDWIKSAAGLTELGEWFHDRLDAEYARHGHPPHTHEHDPAHDRYVGACVAMIRAGQPEKAVVLYNRWARLAGYVQVALVSVSPLIIDMVEALVMMTENGDMKVIKCRSAQP